MGRRKWTAHFALIVLFRVNVVLANWMYLGMLGASVPSEGPKNYDIPRSDEPANYGTSICSSVPGLVTKQRNVCEEQPSSMSAVILGIRRGILECQKQFQSERWNCTPEGDDNVFGYTLTRGSRETAFIHGILSAGVVHGLTEACSAGNLTMCSCDRSLEGLSTPEGWKWGGCSDNVQFGTIFARHFVDAPEKESRKSNRKRDVRDMMNLHNNNAGRLAISRYMQRKCRCHGVSGSCELKTCWKKLPSFVEVGNYLKKKYDESVLISLKPRKRLRRRGKRKVPVRKDDLVYINKSPNYCIEDPANGIFGTSGRLCNKTSTGPDGCNLLCCGRGYNTQVVIHVNRCHCKFHWCCYVTCRKCTTEMEIYTCK
ncbi:protein Wnt-16-like [Tachypleus tridentatus]|uniref:protein Wnt-16-like n=1 Tax=Tachypleus tridentatus TaxID=6853 RepID=UPI003FD3453E